MLMTSFIRVLSFSSRFGGSFLRQNVRGLPQLSLQQFGTSTSWGQDNRSNGNSRGASNRFKRTGDNGEISGATGESSRSRDDFESRTDVTDANHSPRQFSSGRSRRTENSFNSADRPSYNRGESSEREPSRGGNGYQRRESYSSDSVDYASRRGETNYRRSSPREDYGNYNTYSDRRYQPSYDQGEKTEPIYGYYEGDHLYGITSVRLALSSGRRQIKELIVQSGMDLANKKDAKAAQQILDLAAEKGVEIREFSKHDLNMLSDNRPHQGFVLRAQPLEFTSVNTLEPSENYR